MVLALRMTLWPERVLPCATARADVTIEGTHSRVQRRVDRQTTAMIKCASTSWRRTAVTGSRGHALIRLQAGRLACCTSITDREPFRFSVAPNSVANSTLTRLPTRCASR
jgi:hypothetical protein